MKRSIEEMSKEVIVIECKRRYKQLKFRNGHSEMYSFKRALEEFPTVTEEQLKLCIKDDWANLRELL